MLSRCAASSVVISRRSISTGGSFVIGAFLRVGALVGGGGCRDSRDRCRGGASRADGGEAAGQRVAGTAGTAGTGHGGAPVPTSGGAAYRPSLTRTRWPRSAIRE